MPLTKQYLRYSHFETFNVISSPSSNISFIVYQGQEGRYLAAAACENVCVWDLRLGEKVFVIPNENHVEVTHLCPSPDKIHIAVGYSDGTIGITNIVTGELKTVFAGHRSAITTLAFDRDGHRLASGAKDTEIVTWDMIGETGLERLSGHKGVVTSVVFMNSQNVIISSSKDTYIKLWDLDTAYCFNTIATHITEVWSISLVGDDEFLVAGSNDSELMVWNLEALDNVEHNDDVENKFNVDFSVNKFGSILRDGKGRVVSMSVDNSGRILTLHGSDTLVESFLFLKKEEAAERAKKRQSKEQKKAASNPSQEIVKGVTIKDTVRRMPSIKASSKVKFASGVRGSNELRVGILLNNNQIELYSVSTDVKNNKNEEPKLLRSLKSQGHQGEVRSVAFSSDGLAIVSAGSTSIKMWNRTSLKCLRTIPCSQASCACFVPGDRHALVGLKSGHLLVVDLSAGEVIEEVPAHTAEITGITITDDQACAITCSADTTAKVWKFDLVKLEGSKAKVLSVLHTRTLKLDDQVLAVKQSPFGKLIAVALLDSTVKVFFMDTFKFFLSLYGHKLPVTCIDISSDGTLLVSGSGDRNAKIWGLDFGDCHKSFFAHDDGITAVAFVPNTHYFFTAGKDGKIKEWDGDSFVKILTLDGHFGECYSLSLTKEFVVTCGKDHSIRLYEKTLEPLVLSDEQEEEREKEELATGQDSIVKLPSTKTVSAERAAEMLMECLDILIKFKEEEKATGKPPVLPPLMNAYKVKTPAEYLGKILGLIRASDLGETLLLLPLHMVTFMFKIFPSLLKDPDVCETSARSLALLLKVHLGPISVDTAYLSRLGKLKKTAFEAVRKFRDMVGVNLYGLKFIQRDIEEREGVMLFKDATINQKEKINRKRKKDIAKRSAAILKL